MDYAQLDNKTITATSFFGALTFASFVLLMQFSDKIQYSEILIPWTAVVSFFFILVTVGILNADNISNKERLRKLLKFSFVLGFYGLIFLIPFLVLSFSFVGFIVILIIEIICVAILNSTISKSDND